MTRPFTFCRRFVLAIMMLWCGLQAPLAQAQGIGNGKLFRETLGVGVKFSQGQPLTQLFTLEQLGVSWVRDSIMWADVETKPGRYEDLPNAFKQRLDYYREHNIGIVFVLAYGNPRAYPPTKDNPAAFIDPEAFGRYAAHMAKVLKKSGVRFVLEVWNEPHNFVIQKTMGGQWNGKPPSPWVGHYVKMVREVVAQVKKQDPSVKIIDCEDVWVAHYWFLEEGLPSGLDGFGIHPYSGSKSIGPEVISAYEKTDWAMPFQLVDKDRSLHSAIRRLKEQGLKKLGKTPEIWITEWGWSIGEKLADDSKVSESMVAAFLPRAFILAAAAGVEATTWFSAYDSVDGPLGLIANDGRRRPAFQSFRTLSAELGSLVLTKHLAGAGRPTKGVQAYLFTASGVRKLAIWNADNERRELRLDGRWILKKAVNMLGEDIKFKGADSLTVGAEPIYLTIDGNDAVTWSDDLIQ